MGVLLDLVRRLNLGFHRLLHNRNWYSISASLPRVIVPPPIIERNREKEQLVSFFCNHWLFFLCLGFWYYFAMKLQATLLTRIKRVHCSSAPTSNSLAGLVTTIHLDSRVFVNFNAELIFTPDCTVCPDRTSPSPTPSSQCPLRLPLHGLLKPCCTIYRAALAPRITLRYSDS